MAKEPQQAWFPEGYGQEHADIICDRIAAGESLKEICQAKGMPNERSVYRMLARNAAFSQEYARARKTWADAQLEVVLAVSRDPELKADDKRVQIDALKWAMGKLNGKYSDKSTVEHTGKDGAPIQSETKTTLDVTGLTDDQLRALASIRIPSE